MIIGASYRDQCHAWSLNHSQVAERSKDAAQTELSIVQQKLDDMQVDIQQFVMSILDSSTLRHADVQGTFSLLCLFVVQANFGAALADKNSLAASAALTQQRMDSAEHLLSALAGEAVRWTRDEAEFGQLIERLAGFIFSDIPSTAFGLQYFWS